MKVSSLLALPVFPLLICILFLISLSIFSWRRRKVPGALPFAIGSLFAALWISGYVLEFTAADPQARILWSKFQALWMLPSTTAIACFAFEYTWPRRWLSRRNLALLCLPPLLFALLILTSDFNVYIWKEFPPSAFSRLTFGPLAWLFLFYDYFLGLIEILVFIWLFMHSPLHRFPVVVILIGIITGRVIFLLDFLNLVPSAFPFDLLVVPIVFVSYTIALFGFRVFDPIILARRTILEQIRMAVLVLDTEGRIVAINPAAEAIFQVGEKSARGKLVCEMLPALQVDMLVDVSETEIELDGSSNNAGQDEARRYFYSLSVLPLKDWHGTEVGRLLMLRDITEQKLIQAQVIEQQRALAILQEREQLARELHDNISQMFAFINAQGQAALIYLNRGDLTAANAHLERLTDVAQEANVDIRESILNLRAALNERGFFPVLQEYLEQYQHNYGIVTELQQPDSPSDDIFEPLVAVQLMRILQEALTNVRKHSGASCVNVAFSVDNGAGRVSLTDNGKGFNPGNEAYWKDGHVGLRVMRERAAEVGGSLDLHSNPGQGTELVVSVPVKTRKKQSQ